MIILCTCGNHDGNIPSENIRADYAWKLYFGDSDSLPKGHGKMAIPFTNWLWSKLGEQQGFMNPERRNKTVIRMPTVDDETMNFIIRQCSMWSHEVYVCSDLKRNLYLPPFVDIYHDEGLLVRNEKDEIERFFTPKLGPSRLFIRYEKILPGNVSARLHSHSAIDEYYLILKGRGHLNVNGRLWEIGEGTLVGKPRGPDLETSILADLGEPVELLDMEVWPDEHYKEKDVIAYSEHNEIYFRGEGWSGIVPLESMIDAKDIKDREMYSSHYRRNRDGSKS